MVLTSGRMRRLDPADAAMASPLAEATLTVPSSEMSILAPVFHDLADHLAAGAITSRILSVDL
jgi:hypothetical protein